MYGSQCVCVVMCACALHMVHIAVCMCGVYRRVNHSDSIR